MLRLPGIASSLVPAVLVVVPLAGGCQKQVAASGDPQAPYEEDRTTVIGTDGSGTEVRGSTDAPLQDGDCVLVGDQCVVIEETGTYCEGAGEGGPADAIVVDGEVVETICYPPPKEGAPEVTVDADQDGDLDIPQNANNTTVVFDEATDGKNIEGNITIDGNNVGVFGNGPENTIIDGDVTLDGNNVRLRGLTITGDLLMPKNNTAAVLVRVLGNVVIEGNNNVLAASDIYGDLNVTQNNVTLVQNRVQGDFNAAGGNPECTANRAFSDANQDQQIQDSELGDALACGE